MTLRLLTILVCTLYAHLLQAQEPLVIRFVDENMNRKPMHTVAPAYPREARRDRVEGDVKVCFEVDRKGRPFRIAVRESTHRIFESAAKSAVRASLFEPLARGEKVSGIKSCRTFRFRLQPVPPDVESIAVDPAEF